MELKTFDTILSGMCDTFDSLITPKRMSRSNTNIIYLMFKAIAKGYEVINNVCVVLSNKFDPANCADDDLSSVAALVGTERYLGSASGLAVTATNTTAWAVTLLPGTYTYKFDDDIIFDFTILTKTVIEANSYKMFFAFSRENGAFPVETQTALAIESDVDIPTDVIFSCSDNEALLGSAKETNLEFRNRINTDTTRQNSIVELQTSIKNLPYIFDCKVIFNNDVVPKEIDGYTLPPFYMAIFYSGEARNDIAEIVASKGIYPTLATTETATTRKSELLHYYNSVFASGAYDINVIPFQEKEYNIVIKYTLDSIYADPEEMKAQVTSILYTKMNSRLHKDYIKENDIYNIVNNLNIAGVNILNVDLLDGETPVSYIAFPVSCIPVLKNISFEVE